MRLEENILTERLPYVFGGRAVDRFPTNLKPGRASADIPPVSGYTGWWSALARDTLMVDSAGKLSCWIDQSGSNYHLRGYTVGPVFGSRTMNGVLVPDFQGAVETCMYGIAPRDDRSSCTFAVVETDSVSGLAMVVGAHATGGLEFRRNGSALETTTHADLLANMAGVFSASTPCVVAHNISSTSITQYLNGTSETDSDSSSLAAGNRMMLGRDGINGQYWDGSIAEVLYYPSTLAGGDVTSVVNWLKARWGIA